MPYSDILDVLHPLLTVGLHILQAPVALFLGLTGAVQVVLGLMMLSLVITTVVASRDGWSTARLHSSLTFDYSAALFAVALLQSSAVAGLLSACLAYISIRLSMTCVASGEVLQPQGAV